MCVISDFCSILQELFIDSLKSLKILQLTALNHHWHENWNFKITSTDLKKKRFFFRLAGTYWQNSCHRKVKKGVSMVNRNVFRRKKVHGVGGPSRFWKKSIKKNHEFIICRGCFWAKKKNANFVQFIKICNKNFIFPAVYGQLRIWKMWILKISPFGQDYSWGNFRKLTRKTQF